MVSKTEMIKSAKKRVHTLSFVQTGDDSFFIGGKRVGTYEIARMREITAEILASDQFINPLEKLADQDELSRLDDTGKMRYLLDLSSVYVCLKNSMKE